MKLTNADIGNLITALDIAIKTCRGFVKSHSPADGPEDAEIIKENRQTARVLIPLHMRLRRHEKEQLKVHFPKGFPQGKTRRKHAKK